LSTLIVVSDIYWFLVGPALLGSKHSTGVRPMGSVWA
jgi:hypothetical protein